MQGLSVQAFTVQAMLMITQMLLSQVKLLASVLFCTNDAQA
jgi:hypothetical protein